MAFSTKPFNRDKPFKRINNQAFIVQEAPDGFGRKCGCQIPADFGDFEKEFERMLFENSRVLKVIKDAVDAARTVLNVAKAAIMAAISAAAALASLGSGGFGIPAAVAAAAAAIKIVSDVIDTIVDTIETTLKQIFIKLGKSVLPRAVRAIPQWVPVLKEATDRVVTLNQVKEVEGIVTRSFGNPIDVPFHQWHHWLNWNVHVTPEAEYAKIIAAQNPPNTTDGGGQPLAKPGSFEIQWDPGPLWRSDRREPFERGFSEKEIDSVDGPMMEADWCWPMTGMFVWASGRWVYDCSRTTTDAEPRMCAMINPCRAIATARWTAVKFPENKLKVPAIQFMFFACKRGGYIDHQVLDDTNYEFIVDLPPIQTVTPSPFHIGHTETFPANAIVLRPVLLKSVNHLSFQNAGVREIQPLVEILEPEDPGQAPNQVKVTIPKADLDGAEAAGFILSLGWRDPDLEQARKVRQCIINFRQFDGRKQTRDSGPGELATMFGDEKGALIKLIKDAVGNVKLINADIPVVGKIVIHVKDIPVFGDAIEAAVAAAINAIIQGIASAAPLEKEEWLMRICVNGEWRSKYFDHVKEGNTFFPPAPPPQPGADPPDPFFQFRRDLAEDDVLSISVSGVEFDPVGDMMREAHLDRIIALNNRELPWHEIVTPDPDPEVAKKKRREMVFQYVFKVITGNSATTLAMGLENSLLGIIDPDTATKGGTPKSNPIVLKDAGEIKLQQVFQDANFAHAVGDQKILMEQIGTPDYRIFYDVTIEKQKIS